MELFTRDAAIDSPLAFTSTVTSQPTAHVSGIGCRKPLAALQQEYRSWIWTKLTCESYVALQISTSMRASSTSLLIWL